VRVNAEAPVQIVLRVPIRFDAQNGDPIHAPVVLATIGAIHTRLILDTGSDVHLLTAELAGAAGLSLASVDQGTDHAGSSLDSWLVGDVSVAFDRASPSEPILLRDVVAIPAPAAFSAQGIGGILSPQRLHATAFAVIDEIDDELTLADGAADAIRAWLRTRRGTPDVIALGRRAGDDRPIVQASIEPHPELPVLVNTGGRHTEFAPEAVPGLAAGDLERIGTGVSGAAVMGARGGSGVLRLGDHRVALRSVMLRSGMVDPPAMLGQDVLRGSVVAVGPDSGTPVLWQVAELDAEVAPPAR
jgi:hypothetical protein